MSTLVLSQTHSPENGSTNEVPTVILKHTEDIFGGDKGKSFWLKISHKDGE